MFNPFTDFTLTAIFEKDSKTGEYCAYFAELPTVLAEGENQAIALNNLWFVLASKLKHERDKRVTHGAMIASQEFRLSVTE
jgi:predicted RNase H-like HicB family nuclease